MTQQRRRPTRHANRRRPVDAARRVAFDALRAIHAHDAYANLVLGDLLGQRQLTGRDAAFATELVNGTCRAEGSYDQIIAAASGRGTGSLQPAVLDVLRLGTHQLLAMRVPTHAAVDASVNLAAGAIGERVAGLVNAVLRKVAARDREGWDRFLAENLSATAAQALRTDHPEWVVTALAAALEAGHDTSTDELDEALQANNVAPTPTLVVRPGLSTRDELVSASGGTPTEWSPFGVRASGYPGDLELIRHGRAGVQDEGSQLVAWALTQVPGPIGPWLDLCAGPGGKSALLLGLARAQSGSLLAAERQPHRARLVTSALQGYRGAGQPDDALVVTADGTQPAWRPASFARVLADVPCTGLGALRRRPEARWRRNIDDLPGLVTLQRRLLHSAIEAASRPVGDEPGGVVAYVTCSPHVAETDEVVTAVLGERDDVEVLDAPEYLATVPDCARTELAPGASSAQLWPHRHGTDAMYLALLRRV